jgi:hypothetical protein
MAITCLRLPGAAKPTSCCSTTSSTEQEIAAVANINAVRGLSVFGDYSEPDMDSKKLEAH